MSYVYNKNSRLDPDNCFFFVYTAVLAQLVS